MLLAESSSADTVIAIGQLGPIGLIVIPLVFAAFVVAVPCITALLIWRGNHRLGFVGLGPDIMGKVDRIVAVADRIANALDHLRSEGKIPDSERSDQDEPRAREGGPASRKAMPSSPRQQPRREQSRPQ